MSPRSKTALAALLYNLGAVDFVTRQHYNTLLEQVCSTPAPGDMPAVETLFERHEEEDGSAAAILYVNAEIGESALPVAVEIHADSESADLHVRAGGWLVCAIYVTDLSADGELLDVSSIENPQPTLEAEPWPEAPDDPEEQPQALDVRYSIHVSHDVLLQMFQAEELTIRIGQLPIEVSPGDSEPIAELLAYLEEAAAEEDAEQSSRTGGRAAGPGILCHQP